jgi:YidC/Oxa1 family membrane protein insertase
MDRNSMIGLGLIFLLLIGYFYLNQPSEKEQAVQKRYADSIARVQKLVAAQAEQAFLLKQKNDSLAALAPRDTNALQAKYGSFASSAIGSEQEATLENKDLRITFSNKGGHIKQVELKNYKTDSRKPLLLMDTRKSENYYEFQYNNQQVRSDDFYWELKQAAGNSIIYRLSSDADHYIEHVYTVKPDGFNVDHQIRTVGMNQLIRPNSNLSLHWNNDIPLQERELEKEKALTTFYFKYPDERADYISESKFESVSLKDKTEWVSFKQQFFNSTIFSKDGFAKGSTIKTEEPKNSKNIKYLAARLELPYSGEPNKTYDIKFYFGPNQYKLLKEQNIGLDKIIPLGWGIFGWINRFMIIPIFNFLQGFLSNYGIIILLLTLIIKTLLLPLVFKSYKSTAKMRLLKPEMDEIKERNKDNMQGAQMENLQLYKKAGVNPLGGCLPMLLQMPILVAVFQFVPSAFEFRQQAFLWADDLSIYDSIWNFGKLPIINTIYGDHVSLFTLLMTISTLIYTRMNNQLTGVNDQMKYISYLMPILFLGFFNKYAAALTYYYFLSNVVTFTQQWAIKKFVDEDKLKAQIHEARNKKGSEVKKSAFQKRLEDMAKSRGVDMNQLGKKKK